MNSKLILCFVLGLISLSQCLSGRRNRGDNIAEPSIDNPAYVNADLEPAASGHHGHGRVHIKVYRGPSDGHHAPHGFWVKQPADDGRN